MLFQSYENNKAYPILVLMLLALIWGSSFILIKKGLIAFSALQVGTIRVGFAFLILLPFAIKKLKSVFKLRWKLFLVYGLVANLFPAVLFALAETGLSSSLTGILNSLTPIFTLVVGMLFFKIGMQKGQTIGLALGLIGSVLISLVGAEGGIGHFNYYVIFVVAATILYGIAGNMVRSLFMDIDSLTLTAMAFFSIGPISLVTLFSTDFFSVMANAESAWSSLFYLFILSAIGTAFALILFNKLIQMTSAVFGSTVTYMIPIAAIIWGIIDGESLFPLHFVGVGLIVGGVYIVNKFK